MKLSDTQRVILSEASQHEMLLAPLPKLPKAAGNAVLKSLLKNGLLAECPAPREHIFRGWRQDENETWIALRITDAGLRAIGVDPAEVAQGGDTAATGAPDAAPQEVPAESADATHAVPLANDAEEDDDRPRHERNGVSDDLIYGPADEDNGGLHPVTPPRTNLREAGAALLRVWDAVAARGFARPAEGQDDGVAAAIEQLRAVLATKPAREPGAARKPREGTKQEAVLAMLRRPEGATVAQIAEAMAWEQHTVRGFFAGLKRKGITVVAAERVPTAEGWATMGALLVGDTLFDELGQPCRVTGVSRIIIGRRCYTIAFDDGEHIVCDGTHRWPVWDFTNNERPVERLLGTEEMQGRVRIGAGPRYRYAIDCCAPAELPKQDLVIPPYVLGVWLGDGSSIMNHVSVHEDDAEIAEHLSACGVDAQFRLSRWRNGRCANIVIDPTFRLVDDGMTPASIQHRSRFTT